MSEILVNSAPGKVFALISDLTQHSRFAAHELVIEPVEESAIEAGKRYRSYHGTKKPDGVTVTEVVPGSKFAFHVDMPNGIHVDHTITIRPSPGGTIVTRDQRIVGTPGRFLMIQPIIRFSLQKATRKNLKNLKQWIESTEC